MLGIQSYGELATMEDRYRHRWGLDAPSPEDAEDEPFESFEEYCRRELSYLDSLP